MTDAKAIANENFVRKAQKALGVKEDGWAGPDTERAFNARLGLAPEAPTGCSHKVSQRGIDLIKAHEGLALNSYPDPGSGGEPWTIGFGHTKGVKKGDRITVEMADRFLREDLDTFEQGVSRLAPVATQNQFDALVSFAFNVGLGNLEKSTLLKKHNAGDYAGAAGEFSKWNKASGRVMNGLVARRAHEASLYAA